MRRAAFLILAITITSVAPAQRPAGIADRAAGAVVSPPAEPGFAGADLVFRVPVTVRHLHPDVAAARVDCLVTGAAGTPLGTSVTPIPLGDGNGFEGTIVVPMQLEADFPIPARYGCKLELSDGGEFRPPLPGAEPYRQPAAGAEYNVNNTGDI